MIIREFLLIDRFVCEFNSNAREFVQSVDTWTLEQLKEYFFEEEIVHNQQVNVNITIDDTMDYPNQQIPSTPMYSSEIVVECEPVCSSKYYEFFCFGYCLIDDMSTTFTSVSVFNLPCF